MPAIRSRAPLRLVSLAPNATSILLALGAGREVVGVSKWCKDVAPVGRRPQVGDCWKADLREVMRLKPTLLIGSVPFATQTVDAILKEPVAFLGLNPRTLADIYRDMQILARLVNREAAGERLIRRMQRAFAEMATRAAHLGIRPRVYCEAWPNPRISSPPWVRELVEIAGGRMVVRPGARVTDEEIARAKPHLIVLAWAATGDRAKPEAALHTASWRNVPAISSGRVVVIRDELLNTPGPPLVQGARALFRAIHSRGKSRMRAGC
jgi:iron complex transport system substrate-binding protein